ncbi:hypothetical protein BZA70DRAFT_266715 [Myxozyma melibiosi]|uniref:Uncharacterized protein n=1 Tax=Myxozyma melibiosi TaxID=54550 RepID=A0ABR1F9H0_9ASCO
MKAVCAELSEETYFGTGALTHFNEPCDLEEVGEESTETESSPSKKPKESKTGESSGEDDRDSKMNKPPCQYCIDHHRPNYEKHAESKCWIKDKSKFPEKWVKKAFEIAKN